MERRKFITRVGTSTAAISAVVPLLINSSCTSNQLSAKCCLNKGEIQHMVIFNLQSQKGTVQAKQFLEDGKRILSAIPVVQNFQSLNQVSVKNDYEYGFSMIFTNREDYDTYNNHPEHVAFVESRWEKEVSRFLEIDFEI